MASTGCACVDNGIAVLAHVTVWTPAVMLSRDDGCKSGSSSKDSLEWRSSSTGQSHLNYDKNSGPLNHNCGTSLIPQYRDTTSARLLSPLMWRHWSEVQRRISDTQFATKTLNLLWWLQICQNYFAIGPEGRWHTFNMKRWPNQIVQLNSCDCSCELKTRNGYGFKWRQTTLARNEHLILLFMGRAFTMHYFSRTWLITHSCPSEHYNDVLDKSTHSHDDSTREISDS